MEREANRIRYNDMLAKGLVRIVRRRYGGGYFTILTPPEGVTGTKRVAFRSRFVHVAVGYPGLKFLPDLQAYRTENKDYHHIVNAYEPHEHVYERLMTTPSTVLVRGGGIVASRVLQRLMDDRLLRGSQTQIVHLFRTFINGANDGTARTRRAGSCDARAPTAGPTRASTTRSRCGAASSSGRCASSRARTGPRSTSGWAAPTRRTAATGRSR